MSLVRLLPLVLLCFVCRLCLSALSAFFHVLYALVPVWLVRRPLCTLYFPEPLFQGLSVFLYIWGIFCHQRHVVLHNLCTVLWRHRGNLPGRGPDRIGCILWCCCILTHGAKIAGIFCSVGVSGSDVHLSLSCLVGRFLWHIQSGPSYYLVLPVASCHYNQLLEDLLKLRRMVNKL